MRREEPYTEFIEIPCDGICVDGIYLSDDLIVTMRRNHGDYYLYSVEIEDRNTRKPAPQWLREPLDRWLDTPEGLAAYERARDKAEAA